MWPPFSFTWLLLDDHMECEKWSNLKYIALFELPDQKNCMFLYATSAIRTIGFMWPPFSCSWPLFDDHMECQKWSNFKNIAFFEFPDQKNVCFDMPQVYSAIKNQRIHVTTFFCDHNQCMTTWSVKSGQI